MSVSKKRYVNPPRDLAGDIQATRRCTEATTARLAEREEKLRELDSKVQLFAEKARRAGEVQKRLDIKTKEQELVKRDLEAKELVVEERCSNKITLKMELKTARAVIGRRKMVIHDFTKRVCTGYTTLLHAQTFRYCDCLNDLLGDAQARGESLGGFHIRVGEAGN